MHVMQRTAVSGTKNTITTVDKIVLHKYITILQNFFSVTLLGNICSHMYKKKKKRLITASYFCTQFNAKNHDYFLKQMDRV